MNKEPQDLKERISSLSDEEILRMIYVDSADYREEALAFAKEELKKRNIEKINREQIEELRKKPQDILKEVIPSSETSISTWWLNFYTYVRLPLGIAFGLYSLLGVVVIENLLVIIFTIFIIILECVFVGIVFIGLHKKRLWGWQLNWFLLIAEPIFRPMNWYMEGEINITWYYLIVIILGLVWFLPNAIYFKNRRFLFSGEPKPDSVLGKRKK